MTKQILIAGIVTLTILVGGTAMYVQTKAKQTVILEHTRVFGECDGDCTLVTKLYSSGKIESKDKSATLSSQELKTVQAAILEVLETECPIGTITFDVSDTYYLDLNGKSKTVELPYCSNQLGIISDILLTALNPKKISD
jgi:hypothetical protein